MEFNFSFKGYSIFVRIGLANYFNLGIIKIIVYVVEHSDRSGNLI